MWTDEKAHAVALVNALLGNPDYPDTQARYEEFREIVSRDLHYYVTLDEIHKALVFLDRLLHRTE